MGIYRYSELYIETTIARARRNRLRFCLVCVIAIAIMAVLLFAKPHWLSEHHGSGVLIAIVLSLFVHPLYKNLRNWKRSLSVLEESLRQARFEVSAEGVSYDRSAPYRQGSGVLVGSPL